MGGVTIGSEADFPTNETLERAQGCIVARFPSFPNSLRSLPGVDVAGTFHTEATVFFVPAMHAIAAYQTVQARPNRFGGGNGFDEYPNLNHVARLPVVGRGGEARCNDHAIEIFMEKESVHWAPPIQRDSSQSPLRMIVVMIASQKRAARMRFERVFMI